MENEIKVGDKVIHLREEKTVEWIRGNDFALIDKKGAMWLTARSCCKKKNDDGYDADMIDKLTCVQKADFAKRALELERDCATYKNMFEEVSRERNAWISEYRAARSEVETLKGERKQIIETNASKSLQLMLIEQSLGKANATIVNIEFDLTHLKEKYEDLLDRYTTAVADGHDLLKSNESKDETIERLEGELTEAVKIMGAIYNNVDKYHLNFAFAGGECYDRLKEYLGV